MSSVQRVKYKELFGIVAHGDVQVTLNDFGGVLKLNHMRKAAYLATMCEAPTWGTVQSYDNAGMSGGPFHFIARYPSDGKQGPLFGLLRRIEQSVGDSGVRCDPLTVLWTMLKTEGWYIAADGLLRDIHNGTVVSGNAIRDVFAPINGVVPDVGPLRVQAEDWAKAFRALLSNPATFAAQVDYCITYLLTTQREAELKVYRMVLGKPVLDDLTNVVIENPSLDLALCVYHSHSVNAPGAAVECLKSVGRYDINFSKQLIRSLGKKRYGAWYDTLDGRNRYDHTREAALKSGLWAHELFAGDNAIMPENL